VPWFPAGVGQRALLPLLAASATVTQPFISQVIQGKCHQPHEQKAGGVLIVRFVGDRGAEEPGLRTAGRVSRGV
jgi:hypothetical protein